MTSGYTLPVWVAVAAKAALQRLLGVKGTNDVSLALLQPDRRVSLPCGPLALLEPGVALGSSRCDPGDQLDLTRGLEVWVTARLQPAGPADDLLLVEAGEGVGVQLESGAPCLSAYALRLLRHNLLPLIPPARQLLLRVVLPEGARLALRTSNAAFGVVDGLALIGTAAEVQRGAAPDQLARARQALRRLADDTDHRQACVLVIGENGLDLARARGLAAGQLIKAGNWLGPLLAEAAELGLPRVLLFGYHGKLIKLAGGIFHTHHHLADGRMAIVTAFAALEGLAGAALRRLHDAATLEEGLNTLRRQAPSLSQRLEQRLVDAVENRAQAYVARYSEQRPQLGAVLFDRSRSLRMQGPIGRVLLSELSHGTTGAAHLGSAH